jgi:hypothetical protein
MYGAREYEDTVFLKKLDGMMGGGGLLFLIFLFRQITKKPFRAC